MKEESSRRKEEERERGEKERKRKRKKFFSWHKQEGEQNTAINRKVQ
jgi:hypothetical protein